MPVYNKDRKLKKSITKLNAARRLPSKDNQAPTSSQSGEVTEAVINPNAEKIRKLLHLLKTLRTQAPLDEARIRKIEKVVKRLESSEAPQKDDTQKVKKRRKNNSASDNGSEHDAEDGGDDAEDGDDDAEDGDDDADGSGDDDQKETPTAPNLEFGSGNFGSTLFDDLVGLSDATRTALRSMSLEKMTPIQAKSIPQLLAGRDVLASAKTGSGKTLAFLIPVVELMRKLEFKARNGAGCIILSPTRELSMQTYGVLEELNKTHGLRIGLVMGGTNRAEEARKLVKGYTVLVATPGRLLDHLQSTANFVFYNMKCLVIDEADRCLDLGFQDEMEAILRLLPSRRQTMMFSATVNGKTRGLATRALSRECLNLAVDDDASEATTSGLEQGYVVSDPSKRFLLLYSFLRMNKNKKCMVFMSSCVEVKFYTELLNFIDVPVMSLHGRQQQKNRARTFFEFGRAATAILLCTDVAARGLDIPRVDWIIQYDPPDDPREYIHRVGRTARAGANGRALLFLRPNELHFLKYLRAARVRPRELEVSPNKIKDIQAQLEKLIAGNFYLTRSANDAYKGFVRAYASHQLKEVFVIEELDLAAVARCFGLSAPPLVDLDVHSRKKKHAGGRREASDLHSLQSVKNRKKAAIYKRVGGK